MRSASFKLRLPWVAMLLFVLGFIAWVPPLGAQTTTVLSGPFMASGTESGCSSSDAYSLSGTATITLQPSLASLAAVGGQVTGTTDAPGTQSFCGTQEPTSASGTVTGTVAAGGQTTLTITLPDAGQNGCSFTATGTPSKVSGTIPPTCF